MCAPPILGYPECVPACAAPFDPNGAPAAGHRSITPTSAIAQPASIKPRTLRPAAGPWLSLSVSQPAGSEVSVYKKQMIARYSPTCGMLSEKGGNTKWGSSSGLRPSKNAALRASERAVHVSPIIERLDASGAPFMPGVTAAPAVDAAWAAPPSPLPPPLPPPLPSPLQPPRTPPPPPPFSSSAAATSDKFSKTHGTTHSGNADATSIGNMKGPHQVFSPM